MAQTPKTLIPRALLAVITLVLSISSFLVATDIIFGSTLIKYIPNVFIIGLGLALFTEVSYGRIAHLFDAHIELSDAIDGGQIVISLIVIVVGFYFPQILPNFTNGTASILFVGGVISLLRFGHTVFHGVKHYIKRRR